MSRWAWTAPMRALALCALSGACVEQAERPVAALDVERYALEVQPFVAASCATLDCHGEGGRPLRLYSELGLRGRDALRPSAIDSERDPLALTAEELADNVRAFAALAAEDEGDEQLALSKPLARGAGGGHHVGGDLFDSREHPGYLCLARWLGGGDADEDSCAEALELVSPPAP